GIHELIPARVRNQQVETPMNNSIINREVNRAQRIIEGKNFDIRKNLLKYAYFLEVQRKIIHQFRQQTLDGKFESIFLEKEPEGYRQVVQRYGEHAVRLAEAAVIRAVIDRRWA